MKTFIDFAVPSERTLQSSALSCVSLSSVQIYLTEIKLNSGSLVSKFELTTNAKSENLWFYKLNRAIQEILLHRRPPQYISWICLKFKF